MVERLISLHIISITAYQPPRLPLTEPDQSPSPISDSDDDFLEEESGNREMRELRGHGFESVFAG